MFTKSLAPALAGAILAGAAVAQAPIAIGTNPQGSLAYVSGSAIANIIGTDIGRSFVVVPLGGPSAIIPAMIDGEFDFSFANVTAAAEAHAGIGSFEGRAYPDLRVATIVYPLQLGVFAREDSGIASMEDLAGKRVASDFTSQRNLSVFLDAALQMSGMSYEDVQPVPVQSGVQAIDELIDGALDATIFSVTSSAVARADASVGVSFLSVPDDDAARQKLTELAPGSSIGTVPSGATAGVNQDTAIIVSPFVVLTTAGVDEDTVHQVVSSIAKNAEALAKTDPQFSDMTVESMADPELPIPYHPGAIRFFEEQGVWN